MVNKFVFAAQAAIVVRTSRKRQFKSCPMSKGDYDGRDTENLNGVGERILFGRTPFIRVMGLGTAHSGYSRECKSNPDTVPAWNEHNAGGTNTYCRRWRGSFQEMARNHFGSTLEDCNILVAPIKEMEVAQKCGTCASARLHLRALHLTLLSNLSLFSHTTHFNFLSPHNYHKFPLQLSISINSSLPNTIWIISSILGYCHTHTT